MTQEIKRICLDLNKTLIKENTWYDLNLAMGISHDEDQSFLNEYLAGRLSYVDWQKELEKLYIKSGKATFQNIAHIINSS